MEAYLRSREIERIRRITNLVVRGDKEAVDAELAEPVGAGFWQALASYSNHFTELPSTFETELKAYRFDRSSGMIAEVPLWEDSTGPSDVHLSFLVELLGDIPRITITNLRIP